MADRILRVLLVDDDEDDFVLARELLEDVEGTAYEVEWANEFDAALERMKSATHHVCFLDYNLGSRTGLDLLRAATADGVDTPVIMFTGQRDRETDMEAMRAGAYDYLVKGRFDGALLERTIRYVLNRKEIERALRASNEKLERANLRIQEN